MVIYADVVFLINFFGDFLCLWLLSETEGRIPLVRRIFAAVFGGVYAVLCTFPSLRFAGGIIGEIAAAAIMAVISYAPVSIKRLVRGTIIFFIGSMLLAGGAELVGARVLPKVMLTLFAAVCMGICVLSAVRSKIYAKYLPCRLCLLGKIVRVTGFYDSGNRLIDEKDSAPVVVGDVRLLKSLISDEVTIKNLDEWVDAKRIVKVPFAGAARGEMTGIVLDYLKVGEHCYDNIILAVSEEAIEDRLVLNSIMV